MGPIGAARVGYINGGYKLNPPLPEMENSTLDLVVAGTADAVLMVESEAKELPEDVMLGAVMFGHKHFQPVIEAIIRLAEKAAKEPRDYQPADTVGGREGGARHRRGGPARGLQEHRQAGALRRRRRRQGEGDGRALPRPRARRSSSPRRSRRVFKDAQAKVVRWNILDNGKRIDGRDVKTVRPIVAEVGVLPRAHGSALFTRGETQALVVATLGTGEDEQYID